jgi:hypothetical protein
MKKAVTLAIVILLVVIISIASVIVIQYAFTNNWYNYTANVKSQQLEREALTFIKNIIQLDYTKYYGKIGDLPNPENPYTFQYYVNYQNDSNLSASEKYQQMLTITYLNVNQTEISFTISTDVGLISYHDDGINVIDQSKGILERYQTTYNAPYIQDMLNSLGNYSTITNSSQQVGDIRLDLHSGYGIENITWSRAVGNIPNSFDTLTLLFNNGTFNSFTDNWNRFIIGSSSVNISQEQALQIANQEVQSVQSVGWDGGTIGISGTTINDNSVTYALSFQPIGNTTYGETGTLAPCWQLNGNVTYPLEGNTLLNPYFSAVIRADTGQIQKLQLGSYSMST